jgi:hypothetical protein
MDKISRNCYWLSLTKLFVDEVNQNDLATLSLFCYIHAHARSHTLKKKKKKKTTWPSKT